MERAEKIMFAVFLIVAAVLTFAGMVLGPLGQEGISIALSVAAIVVALVAIGYCLMFWRGNAKKKTGKK